MSELNIYQILKLNYENYKSGGQMTLMEILVSFNLYRNTEKSLILLKRWRGDYKKEEYVLNLIRIQNPDLSEYLLIVYPNIKVFRLLYCNIPK